jgi:hypothetical protein
MVVINPSRVKVRSVRIFKSDAIEKIIATVITFAITWSRIVFITLVL